MNNTEAKTQNCRNKADNRPIGVFDSGLGGLTVVRALLERLPGEDIVYLGDTARVPYGSKSPEAIRQFAIEDMEFLLRRGVKLVVAGCNTVSAVALKTLHERFPQAPLIGVIESGARAVLKAGVGSVAVIGTRATINSDAYRLAIQGADPAVSVESIECPLLVPLAEEGMVDGALAQEVLELYLGALRERKPEALVLGCTHYPLFKAELERFFAGALPIIDSATACAEHVKCFLEENHLAAQGCHPARYDLFVSDLPSRFYEMAERFLGRRPARVEKVQLGNL